MKPAPRVRLIAWIAAGLAVGCLWVSRADTEPVSEFSDTAAQTPSDSAANPSSPASKSFISDIRSRMIDDMVKMRELFDTTIPGTLKKYNLVFSFSPRASDVRKGEFVRLPATIRYGLSNRWELSTGVTPFCPNPINSGYQHRWGMGMGSLGIRYNWGHWGKLFDQVTIGVDGRTPLGKPPKEIIDYYAHAVPYINTSRPLPFPHTTLYTNISYDQALDAPWREHDDPPADEFRSNIITVTPGVLYKPGEFGAFFEHNWRRYRIDTMGTHFGYEFKVGPIWDVPLWRTRSWGLPGKWQVEVAGRVSFEEGYHASTGVSLRVRWRTTIRELFTKKSYQRVPPPAQK